MFSFALVYQNLRKQQGRCAFVDQVASVHSLASFAIESIEKFTNISFFHKQTPFDLCEFQNCMNAQHFVQRDVCENKYFALKQIF